MRWYLVPILCLVALAAEARVYQWVSPHTGTVQMSGAPPGWYRAGGEGPRVLVYDQGRLVDDTAVAVSEERRQRLREYAFRELEERRQAQALGQLGQAAREQAAQAQREALLSGAREGGLEGDSGGAGARDAGDGFPGELDQEMVETLKAIVAEWDRRNADVRQPGETPEGTPEGASEAAR